MTFVLGLHQHLEIIKLVFWTQLDIRKLVVISKYKLSIIKKINNII